MQLFTKSSFEQNSLLVIARQLYIISNINDTDGDIGLHVEGEVRTWYVTLPEVCLSSHFG